MRRKSLKLLLLSLILVSFVPLMTKPGNGTSSGVSQPIPFNHLVHTQKAELECDVCHRYVKDEEYAGRPEREICAACHENALTESAGEAVLLEFIRSAKDIPWRRLYDIPNHVYYSHRRHVTVAKIDCGVCHGPIGLSKSPPENPLKIISMEFCISCHEKQGATVDCNGCHR